MLPSTELTIRLGFFAGVLLLMWLGEILFPRRRLSLRKGPRWGSNLGLVVVNSLFVRLVVPVTAVVAGILPDPRLGFLQSGFLADVG